MSEKNMIPSSSSSQNDNSRQNETLEIDDSQNVVGNNPRMEEVPSTSRETYLVEESIASTSQGTAIIDDYIRNMIPRNLLAGRNVCYSVSQYASSSSTSSSSNEFESNQSENTAYLEPNFLYDQPEISTRFALPECLYNLHQPSTSREISTITVNRDYPSEFLFNTLVVRGIPSIFDPDEDDQFNLTEEESTELFELLAYGFRSFRGTYENQIPHIDSDCMKTIDLMLNIITQIMGQFGGIGHIISSRSGIVLIDTMLNVCTSDIPDSSYVIKVAFLRCLKDIIYIPAGRTFLLARHKFLISIAQLLESNAPPNLKCFAMRIIIAAIQGTPRDNRHIPVKRFLACIKKYLENVDKNSVLARKTMRHLEAMVIEPSPDTSDDD